jgi:hypothetical protein
MRQLKFRVWENLIEENLTRALSNFDNVVFCWNEQNEKT